MKPEELGEFICNTIFNQVDHHGFHTAYHQPLIGFVDALDPRFSELSERVEYPHHQPEDLLPGARSVVCFFLPFVPEIAYANQKGKGDVAYEWALAYQETNALIGRITSRLIVELGGIGVRAAAEPATGNFNSVDLRSHWSHKSIAVLAGIGSFGLHQLVITDAGCAGRFGSLVIDAELPVEAPEPKERCEYYALGTCMDCVLACPAKAISEDSPLDRVACWEQLIKNSKDFLGIGDEVKVCGKCAVLGPCALEAAA